MFINKEISREYFITLNVLTTTIIKYLQTEIHALLTRT